MADAKLPYTHCFSENRGTIFLGLNTPDDEILRTLAIIPEKGMNYSKSAMMHSRAIDFFQAWYDFFKPHKPLRLNINCGNKRWLQRTPATAQELTDHILTLNKLLTFRVLVQ